MASDLFYEEYVRRAGSFAEDRLYRMVRKIPAHCGSLLDIGCGTGRNLQLFSRFLPKAKMYGTDVALAGVDAVRSLGFESMQCDASVEIEYPNSFFDVVVCGEVIEHVVDTDNLLLEIRRVLKPTGKLILTTPNLAYAVNRLLLLCGLQPLFTETSYQRTVGRRFRFLGQGGNTQGHLKVFTLPALIDLVEMTGFSVASVEGYRFLQSGVGGAIDSMLRLRSSLAAGFVVDARPQQ